MRDPILGHSARFAQHGIVEALHLDSCGLEVRCAKPETARVFVAELDAQVQQVPRLGSLGVKARGGAFPQHFRCQPTDLGFLAADLVVRLHAAAKREQIILPLGFRVSLRRVRKVVLKQPHEHQRDDVLENPQIQDVHDVQAQELDREAHDVEERAYKIEAEVALGVEECQRRGQLERPQLVRVLDDIVLDQAKPSWQVQRREVFE